MPDEATRVGCFYLCDIPASKPIEDLSTEAGKTFAAACQETADNTAENLYWGRVIENPDQILVVVPYPSLAHHLAVRTEAWRSSAAAKYLSLCTQYPTITHVDWGHGIPSEALSAPVTNISVAYFPPGPEGAERRDDLEHKVLPFYQEQIRKLGLPQKLHGAWSIEDDLPYNRLTTFAEDGSGAGGQEGDTQAGGPAAQARGKGLFILNSWDSVEMQHKFHEAPEGAALLSMCMPGGADGWNISHVKFKKVEPTLS